MSDALAPPETRPTRSLHFISYEVPHLHLRLPFKPTTLLYLAAATPSTADREGKESHFACDAQINIRAVGGSGSKQRAIAAGLDRAHGADGT